MDCSVSATCEHLARHGEQFFRGKGPGKKAHTLCRVIVGDLTGGTKDENGHFGEAGVELGHEGGTSDSGPLQTCNHEPEASGELRLFNEAKGFCRVSDSLDVMKPLLQSRFTHERLERVIVHQ
ncbi:MAG: hypothetical protein WCA11_08145 [Terracidiphilus sp.]